MFLLPRQKRFFKPERWPVEGLNHLDSALSQGKGVIILTAHFGYTYFIKRFLKMRQYEVWMVGSPPGKNWRERTFLFRDVLPGGEGEENPKPRKKPYTRFRRFMYEPLRVDVDLKKEILLTSEFNIRPLLDVLRKNEVLIINGDGLDAVRFVNVPFLGRLCPFPTGYMKMAMATGATVLPTFAVDTREGFGIKVIIEKPLELEESSNTEQALVYNVEGFVRIFESYVRRYPYLYSIWTNEGYGAFWDCPIVK